MSRKSVNELLEVLQELGIDLSPKNAEQIPVEDLDLTIVTSNCLMAANIFTVGELIAYSQADLLKIENMSRNSVNELVEVLQGLGLHLSQEQKQ